MAATLQFDLVSPERRLASLTATEVQIPAVEGDMTAMAGHASTITTMRPGLLRVVTENGMEDYAVTGGFAEITPAGTSILAEQAVPTSELTAEMIDGFVALASKAVEGAEGLDLATAQKTVSDLEALRGLM